jgi:hypothetical protein
MEAKKRRNNKEIKKSKNKEIKTNPYPLLYFDKPL